MLTALATLLAASAPVKMAVPGFKAVGVEQQLTDAWVERLVTLLGANGDLQVISARDIAEIVGLERQKELTGCSDTRASCLVELAGALGCDAILSGTIAKGGNNISVTLRVLKSGSGTTLWTGTERVRDFDALQDWLDAQAPAMRRSVAAALGQPLAEPQVVEAAPRKTLPRNAWLVGIGGVIVGGLGSGLVIASRSSSSALRTATFASDGAVMQTASTGRGLESSGYVLLSVGIVAIAAAVAWMLLGSGS